MYPNQGVCKVTAVEVKDIAGQKLTFVTMKREEDGAVVMVPEAKVVAIGVRKVAGAKDVAQVFDFLKSDSDKANLDWKQRARTNVERMAQGGILGLAEVVKGLQVLSELRPLPNKERELYDSARHLLVAEISAALGTEECNAEDAIDIILFPPGRERPKRTQEEFRANVGGDGEDDDLGLEGDLLELDNALDLPLEEEPPAEEEPVHVEEAEEDAPAPKAKKAAKAVAAPVDAAPKKRGRPPKPKVELPPSPPKKRGRPPKPKVELPPEPPKKRGRPPKSAAEKAATVAAAKAKSKPKAAPAKSPPPKSKPTKKK